MLGTETSVAPQWVMLSSLVHAQELEAARHRTREVAYNLNLRIRQELGVPAVMHFYNWLLQGTLHR